MAAAGIRGFLRDWPLIGLPAFAAIFLPWQSKLTAMSLVSEWFQPGLNLGASLVGPMSCFIGYAYLIRKGRQRQVRAMIAAFAIFVVALMICLGLKLVMGTVFFPGPAMQVGVWTLENLLYLTLFASLAVSMIAAGLLVRGG